MEPIQVWKFHDAPEELRSLSEHGGDEDWLALIPPCVDDQYVSWMREGTSFGWCTVTRQEHPTKKGYIVVIGSH